MSQDLLEEDLLKIVETILECTQELEATFQPNKNNCSSKFCNIWIDIETCQNALLLYWKLPTRFAQMHVNSFQYINNWKLTKSSWMVFKKFQLYLLTMKYTWKHVE